jgi:hypothetical protein
VNPTYIIQIPITTDCDPSTLLDLATEAGEQVAEEATRYGSVYGDATVDEQEILVRPAGPTSLERDLLAALEHALEDILTLQDLFKVYAGADEDHGTSGINIEIAKAIAQAGGAK